MLKTFKYISLSLCAMFYACGIDGASPGFGCMWGCHSDCERSTGTFTDPRDGQKYKYVRYTGSDCKSEQKKKKMTQNMNYAAKGSVCYGSIDTGNNAGNNAGDNTGDCDKYGRLYDLETAPDVCPAGWSMPAKGNSISNMNSGRGAYHIDSYEKEEIDLDNNKGSWWVSGDESAGCSYYRTITFSLDSIYQADGIRYDVTDSLYNTCDKSLMLGLRCHQD